METGSKSWWSQRTSLEKWLSLVCAFGAVVALSLLISLVVVAVQKDDELSNICMSNTCIQEASKILTQMNRTVDPCEDFYEFACGTFLKETLIPDDKTQVTAFSIIDTKMREQLRLIVTEPINADEIEPFQNVKKLYRACMDTELIEMMDTYPLRNVFETMGGWPVLLQESDWDNSSWSWQRSAELSRELGYGVNYFLSFSVSTDNRNSTLRRIRIDQASLGLSREYLVKKMDEPFVVAYHNYQIKLAELFGATSERAASDMREVLNFEIELAEISMDREERRDADKLYNLRTSTVLNVNYAYNDWLSYFNSLLPKMSQLEESDDVIVGALSFFEKLGDLLNKTQKRVLSNYVIWRHVQSSVNYLPARFRSLQQEYVKLTSGREVADPRWLECVDLALNHYPHAFGALYARRHFNKEAKSKALEMVMNIKTEEILKDIDWMDTDTKKAAKTKAESISEQIGFADQLLNDSLIHEYYNSWPAAVVENEYYASVFRLQKASTLRTNERLRQPIDKNDWISQVTPAIVNAFYSSLENSIKFPAGILQGAFFNADRPQYLNYGGIGFVIGHEITHGFDDQGSQYDNEGNLKNWWANVTRAEYKRRAQCIIEQYGNYTEKQTSLQLNGINTQGENIADNGGVKQSYKAYVRWAEKNTEKKLPGLEYYNAQQMFWISAGQIWCSVYREETLKNRITTGVHSIPRFRVIGPLSNSEDFSKDYNCPIGSKMNPVKKCAVW